MTKISIIILQSEQLNFTIHHEKNQQIRLIYSTRNKSDKSI